MSPARRAFRHDVFISYSHDNRDWVRSWLVSHLKHAGLSVCIDYESFEPGAPIITEIEHAAQRSRKTLLVLTPEYLQSAWTEFENVLVQTSDPAARQRRLIPILLHPCDPPERLKLLVYVDFTHSAAQAETLQRLLATIRRRPAAGPKPHMARAVHLPFEIPTGALSPTSPLYIERSHDHVMRQQVTRQGSTTIVEGARQMGKTSLLARAVAHARAQQCTIIDLNFQALGEQQLATLDTLLRYLADALHERLQLAASPEDTWRRRLGTKDKLTSFIRNHVLQGAGMPVVIVMDEVDRVFGRPYQDDFFALLRSWHDQRAFDASWQQVNLILAYSTDPRQAIKDLNQSPFNIGTKIALGDFSFEEVWELNRRYERPLKRKAQLQALVNVIDGQPYLAQRAFYALTTRTHTLPELLDTDSADLGPFSDLLQHYRRILESEPALRQGMQQVLVHRHCPDYGLFSHLQSLGLVTGSHQDARPRCTLYAVYFRRVLS